LIFVEVKKARRFRPGLRLRLTRTPNRLRIQAAALEFLANRGEAMDRAMRFDLACVDAGWVAAPSDRKRARRLTAVRPP
jgi:Holliday junction resolvase-like predicted endonuclease